MELHTGELKPGCQACSDPRAWTAVIHRSKRKSRVSEMLDWTMMIQEVLFYLAAP